MRQVQIIVDGVLLTIKLLVEVSVVSCLLCQILDEVRHFLMPFVLPGRGRAPVVVERLLHLFHLLDSCFLGIALHTGVNGGVNLQAVTVEVVAVFTTPGLQFVLDSLTEIKRLSVVVVLDTIVEVDGFHLQRIKGLFRQVFVNQHVVEHHVAAFQRVVGIDAWVVVSRGLQQSNEDGRLVGGQLLGCRSEVRLGSRLDAESIRTEIHGVGIHGEYFLLVEE